MKLNLVKIVNFLKENLTGFLLEDVLILKCLIWVIQFLRIIILIPLSGLEVITVVAAQMQKTLRNG